MAGEGREETKWAGEYKKDRARSAGAAKAGGCGGRGWKKRDKRNEHVESRSAYRMSNETVRDRGSLIPLDIR